MYSVVQAERHQYSDRIHQAIDGAARLCHLDEDLTRGAIIKLAHD
jgi:hypothetical protein